VHGDDIFKWAFGVGVSLIAFFLRDLHTRFNEHVKVSEVRAIEAAGLKVSVEGMCERLDRMDGKLDRLIERRPA
jgi:hypothetical protein